MASTQELKSRIRSVKSTKQITNAMQLVAASKMRRAQDAAKQSASYVRTAKELLKAMSRHTSVSGHPLFSTREIKKRLFIVVSSDKGLAGAYNSNIAKLYAQELRRDDAAGIQNTTITIGRKASQFVARIKDTQVLGSYQDFADRPDGAELYAILDSVKQMFTSGEVDAVDVIYTDYINSLVQTPVIVRVLPAGASIADDVELDRVVEDATYEPDAAELIDGVAYRLVGAEIYQALLNARASEHSMRMVAMKNSTDNASDLIEDLTLEMNKARQGAITQELAEISGGVEAMNE